jgi:small-conductance mechanosensitive channel
VRQGKVAPDQYQQHHQRHRQHPPRRGWLRLLCFSCLLWLGLQAALGLMPVAQAQGTDALPQLSDLETLAPPEVQDFFSNGPHDLAKAPVYLDGRVVFQVAAPLQAAERPTGLTAPERAQEIQRRLRRIAQLQQPPSDLQITRDIDDQSNQPIIAVNGEVLMTVTSLDAQLAGTGSLTFRALEISQEVRRGLEQAYQERQPAFLWRQTRWAGGALLGAVLANFAIAQAQQSLRNHRRRQLESRQQIPAGEPSTALRNTLINRHADRVYRLQRQSLRLIQGGLWLGGGFYLIGLYPYSRWLQPWLISLLRLPLRLFIIVLVAYGLIRLSEDWLERLFLAMQERTGLTQERSQRLALRLSTFAEVVKSIVAAAICLVAVFAILSQLGIDIAPLLAGAGILGIAISLASQNLIRDIINGFLILIEDQYGVGDVIIVGSVAGFVETMNLRITQLRNEEGRLITVPNGQITVVENLSKEWSRVDLAIPVGLTADIDQALALVETLAQEMVQDGIWGSLILEPPLLLGVDRLDHAGATIRLWMKTQPLKQWDVAREYRRRLKIAFEQAGIPIGVPQQRIALIQGGDFHGTNGRPVTPNPLASEATDAAAHQPLSGGSP